MSYIFPPQVPVAGLGSFPVDPRGSYPSLSGTAIIIRRGTDVPLIDALSAVGSTLYTANVSANGGTQNALTIIRGQDAVPVSIHMDVDAVVVASPWLVGWPFNILVIRDGGGEILRGLDGSPLLFLIPERYASFVPAKPLSDANVFAVTEYTLEEVFLGTIDVFEAPPVFLVSTSSNVTIDGGDFIVNTRTVAGSHQHNVTVTISTEVKRKYLGVVFGIFSISETTVKELVKLALEPMTPYTRIISTDVVFGATPSKKIMVGSLLIRYDSMGPDSTTLLRAIDAVTRVKIPFLNPLLDLVNKHDPLYTHPPSFGSDVCAARIWISLTASGDTNPLDTRFILQIKEDGASAWTSLVGSDLTTAHVFIISGPMVLATTPDAIDGQTVYFYPNETWNVDAENVSNILVASLRVSGTGFSTDHNSYLYGEDAGTLADNCLIQKAITSPSQSTFNVYYDRSGYVLANVSRSDAFSEAITVNVKDGNTLATGSLSFTLVALRKLRDDDFTFFPDYVLDTGRAYDGTRTGDNLKFGRLPTENLHGATFAVADTTTFEIDDDGFIWFNAMPTASRTVRQCVVEVVDDNGHDYNLTFPYYVYADLTLSFSSTDATSSDSAYVLNAENSDAAAVRVYLHGGFPGLSVSNLNLQASVLSSAAGLPVDVSDSAYFSPINVAFSDVSSSPSVTTIPADTDGSVEIVMNFNHIAALDTVQAGKSHVACFSLRTVSASLAWGEQSLDDVTIPASTCAAVVVFQRLHDLLNIGDGSTIQVYSYRALSPVLRFADLFAGGDLRAIKTRIDNADVVTTVGHASSLLGVGSTAVSLVIEAGSAAASTFETFDGSVSVSYVPENQTFNADASPEYRFFNQIENGASGVTFTNPTASLGYTDKGTTETFVLPGVNCTNTDSDDKSVFTYTVAVWLNNVQLAVQTQTYDNALTNWTASSLGQVDLPGGDGQLFASYNRDDGVTVTLTPTDWEEFDHPDNNRVLSADNNNKAFILELAVKLVLPVGVYWYANEGGTCTRTTADPSTTVKNTVTASYGFSFHNYAKIITDDLEFAGVYVNGNGQNAHAIVATPPSTTIATITKDVGSVVFSVDDEASDDVEVQVSGVTISTTSAASRVVRANRLNAAIDPLFTSAILGDCTYSVDFNTYVYSALAVSFVDPSIIHDSVHYLVVTGGYESLDVAIALPAPGAPPSALVSDSVVSSELSVTAQSADSLQYTINGGVIDQVALRFSASALDTYDVRGTTKSAAFSVPITVNGSKTDLNVTVHQALDHVLNASTDVTIYALVGADVTLTHADLFTGGAQAEATSWSLSNGSWLLASESSVPSTIPSTIDALTITVSTGVAGTLETRSRAVTIVRYSVPALTDDIPGTRKLTPRITSGDVTLGTAGLSIGYTDVDTAPRAVQFAITGLNVSVDGFAEPAVVSFVDGENVPGVVSLSLGGALNSTVLVTATPPAWDDFMETNNATLSANYRLFDASVYGTVFTARVTVNERAAVSDDVTFAYTETNGIVKFNLSNNVDGKQILTTASIDVAFKFVHTPLLSDNTFTTSNTSVGAIGNGNIQTETAVFPPPSDDPAAAPFSGTLSSFSPDFAPEAIVFVDGDGVPLQAPPYTYDPETRTVSTNENITPSREEQTCSIVATIDGIETKVSFTFFLYDPIQLTLYDPTASNVVQPFTESFSSAAVPSVAVPPEALSTFTTVNGGVLGLVVRGGYIGMSLNSVAAMGSSSFSPSQQQEAWLTPNVSTTPSDIVTVLSTVNGVPVGPSDAGYVISSKSFDLVTYTISSPALTQVENFQPGKTIYVVASLSQWSFVANGSAVSGTSIGDVVVLQNLATNFGRLSVYVPANDGVTPVVPLSALINGGDADASAYSITVGGDVLSKDEDGHTVLNEAYFAGETLVISVGSGATLESIQLLFSVTSYVKPSVTLYSSDRPPVLFPLVSLSTFPAGSANIGYSDASTGAFLLSDVAVYTDDVLGSVSFVVSKDDVEYDGIVSVTTTGLKSTGLTPVLSLEEGNRETLTPDFLASRFTIGVTATVNVDVHAGAFMCTFDTPRVTFVPYTGVLASAVDVQELYFEQSSVAFLADSENVLSGNSVIVNRVVHSGEIEWSSESDLVLSSDFRLLGPSDRLVEVHEPIIDGTITTFTVYNATRNEAGVYSIAHPVTVSEDITFYRNESTFTGLSLSSSDNADLNSSPVTKLVCAINSDVRDYVVVVGRSRGDSIHNLTKLDRSEISAGDTADMFHQSGNYDCFFPVRVYNLDPVVPSVISTLRRDTETLSTQFPDCCHLTLDAVYSCRDGTTTTTSSLVSEATLLYSLQVQCDHDAQPNVWYELANNLGVNDKAVTVDQINRFILSSNLPERMLMGNNGSPDGDTDFALPSYDDSAALGMLLRYRVMAQQKPVYVPGDVGSVLKHSRDLVPVATYSVETHRALSNLVALQYRDFKVTPKKYAFRTTVMDDGETFDPSVVMVAVPNAVTVSVDDSSRSRISVSRTIYNYQQKEKQGPPPI